MSKRNVFIATLGTGFYGECIYEQDGQKSSKTRFIQKAFLELLRNIDPEWGKDDEILIFMTDKARELNWDLKERESRNKELENYIGLEHELKSLDLPAKIKGIEIPEGKDTGEIWEIFQIIKDEIKEGDQLYIDLTHGYRFMPMMILVLINYLKFLKNTEVKALGYGNYEGRDVDTNIAPIINLMPLVELQTWTFAAADFERNGNARALEEIRKSHFSHIISEKKKQENQEKQKNKKKPKNQEDPLILQRDFIKSVTVIADSLMLCRERLIEDGNIFMTMVDLHNQLTKKMEDVEPAFVDIITTIKDSFSEFINKDKIITNPYMKTTEAIKWCLSKNMLQPAITFASESIITELAIRAKRANIIENEFEENDRTIISRCLSYNRKQHGEPSHYYKKVSKLIHFDELKDIYEKISIKRNDYNHAGTNASNHSNDVDFKNSTEKVIKKLISYKESIKPILINYSNHPYKDWSDQQKELAKPYGECIDISFPTVEPSETTEGVQKLAQEGFENIKKYIKDEYDVTVHIMGEMTLTHALIRLLNKKGIPCIASTAKRDVKELPNGKQEKNFIFEGFREYV